MCIRDRFQPLLSVALSDKWGLYMRPVVTMVNSVPQLDQNGHSERTNGFGDTVLGVARRIRCSAGGSCSEPARRSRFPQRRSESSARTPGRSALMSETKTLQMRRHADAVPGAGSVLP